MSLEIARFLRCRPLKLNNTDAHGAKQADSDGRAAFVTSR
jgi:hypothetical protein